ncbi:hypothetical protein PAPYR_3261 [Paratrimastix pyriformis]|uniref:Uncharacterized protein n=1 Tax=Paratrimastix pyriformis TaxID=342808 RepID=A0ABQ8UN53_9EUKA|nr:hypothetical protein PAPYR_3261 [Paratrimastix pyriformis]
MEQVQREHEAWLATMALTAAAEGEPGGGSPVPGPLGADVSVRPGPVTTISTGPGAPGVSLYHSASGTSLLDVPLPRVTNELRRRVVRLSDDEDPMTPRFTMTRSGSATALINDATLFPLSLPTAPDATSFPSAPESASSEDEAPSADESLPSPGRRRPETRDVGVGEADIRASGLLGPGGSGEPSPSPSPSPSPPSGAATSSEAGAGPPDETPQPGAAVAPPARLAGRPSSPTSSPGSPAAAAAAVQQRGSAPLSRSPLSRSPLGDGGGRVGPLRASLRPLGRQMTLPLLGVARLAGARGPLRALGAPKVASPLARVAAPTPGADAYGPWIRSQGIQCDIAAPAPPTPASAAGCGLEAQPAGAPGAAEGAEPQPNDRPPAAQDAGAPAAPCGRDEEPPTPTEPADGEELVELPGMLVAPSEEALAMQIESMPAGPAALLSVPSAAALDRSRSTATLPPPRALAAPQQRCVGLQCCLTGSPVLLSVQAAARRQRPADLLALQLGGGPEGPPSNRRLGAAAPPRQAAPATSPAPSPRGAGGLALGSTPEGVEGEGALEEDAPDPRMVAALRDFLRTGADMVRPPQQPDQPRPTLRTCRLMQALRKNKPAKRALRPRGSWCPWCGTCGT